MSEQTYYERCPNHEDIDKINSRRRHPVVVLCYEIHNGEQHAILQRGTESRAPLAIDKNGCEYVVGVSVMTRRDGAAELWVGDSVTHVRPKGDPKWDKLEAPQRVHQTVTMADIRREQGTKAAGALDAWLLAVKSWHAGKRDVPRWAFLRGPTGCGKTSAARLMERSLLDASVPYRWYDWRKLVGDFRHARQNQQEDPVTHAWPVIILDDIGTDNASATAAEALLAVLDNAEQHGQVILATGNVGPSEWVALYANQHNAGASGNAERAASRMVRRGNEIVFGARGGAR
jgi:hypothetical protein